MWARKSNITDKFVRLGQDFPKDIAYNGRKLFPVLTKARKSLDKKLVTLKVDNLIISGKRYTVDTLDQLTGHLCVKTFCERSNDKVLVVGGVFSNFHPLSNYYTASFVFRQQKYNSIEQGYQHVKAVLFGDHATAAQILASNDPAATKRLSYRIKGFKQEVWATKRYDLMLQMVKAKFDQNPELCDELRATGKKNNCGVRKAQHLCKRIINHKQRHIGYEAVDRSIQVGGDTDDCSVGTSAKT